MDTPIKTMRKVKKSYSLLDVRIRFSWAALAPSSAKLMRPWASVFFRMKSLTVSCFADSSLSTRRLRKRPDSFKKNQIMKSPFRRTGPVTYRRFFFGFRKCYDSLEHDSLFTEILASSVETNPLKFHWHLQVQQVKRSENWDWWCLSFKNCKLKSPRELYSLLSIIHTITVKNTHAHPRCFSWSLICHVQSWEQEVHPQRKRCQQQYEIVGNDLQWVRLFDVHVEAYSNDEHQDKLHNLEKIKSNLQGKQKLNLKRNTCKAIEIAMSVISKL